MLSTLKYFRKLQQSPLHFILPNLPYMLLVAPLLRGTGARQLNSLSRCINLGTVDTRAARSAYIHSFRPSPSTWQPRKDAAGKPTPILKPEELYPESFPINPNDLVNDSGRIYSVRRPPGEDGGSGGSGGEEDPEGKLAVPFEQARRPSIFRSILFFGLSTAAMYGGAAYLSLEETSEMSEKVGGSKFGIFGDFGSFFGVTGNGNVKKSGEGVSEAKMRAARKQASAEKLGWQLTWLLGWCDQLGIPQGGKEFVGKMYTWGAESYLNLPITKETLVPIIAVNTVVFLGWRFSMLSSASNGLQRFMTRYFVHAPSSGRSYTMLTSTFSHFGGLHFLFNNFAMWSFGAAAFFHPLFYAGRDKTGKHTAEANVIPHFLAFFATAGIFSALISHLVTAVRFRAIAARHGLDLAKYAIGRKGSLGASGAVYSLVVMTAIAFPEAQLGIIFIPFVSFPIGMGVGAMVCVDVVGALLRWRMFDHVAHLGGAAFGLFYWYYGNQIWEACKLRIRDLDSQMTTVVAKRQ